MSQEIRLHSDDFGEFRFRGSNLGSGSTKSDKDMEWTEIAIYSTEGGQMVGHIRFASWRIDGDTSRVYVADSPRDLYAHLIVGADEEVMRAARLALAVSGWTSAHYPPRDSLRYT